MARQLVEASHHSRVPHLDQLIVSACKEKTILLYHRVQRPRRRRRAERSGRLGRRGACVPKLDDSIAACSVQPPLGVQHRPDRTRVRVERGGAARAMQIPQAHCAAPRANGQLVLSRHGERVHRVALSRGAALGVPRLEERADAATLAKVPQAHRLVL